MKINVFLLLLTAYCLLLITSMFASFYKAKGLIYKKMKIFVYFLILISIACSLSCSKSNAASSQKDVVVTDKIVSQDAVVVDDALLTGDDNTSSNILPVSPKKSVTTAEGLHIKTMYDGYGNKTETRSFDDDLLLRNLIVRTSVTGETQVFVFARNGVVKDVPVNMQNKVMTAPASEIAAAAGIYEEIKETPPLVQDNPLADSEFPVLQPQPESAKPSNENPVLPKQNAENPPTKNQSDEQN